MLANQVGLTSKCVSERHYHASFQKLTAGAAAARLRKKGVQIKAKELVESFKLLTGREPEWHHSGFYKKNGRSTMGRTFFFSIEEINEIYDRWNEISSLREAEKDRIDALEKLTVKGFYYIWSFDYSGPRGRKRNFKVLKTYEGSPIQKPKNFKELSDNEFVEAKSQEGKRYYGWDEPNSSEFQISK